MPAHLELAVLITPQSTSSAHARSHLLGAVFELGDAALQRFGAGCRDSSGARAKKRVGEMISESDIVVGGS